MRYCIANLRKMYRYERELKAERDQLLKMNLKVGIELSSSKAVIRTIFRDKKINISNKEFRKLVDDIFSQVKQGIPPDVIVPPAPIRVVDMPIINPKPVRVVDMPIINPKRKPIRVADMPIINPRPKKAKVVEKGVEDKKYDNGSNEPVTLRSIEELDKRLAELNEQMRVITEREEREELEKRAKSAKHQKSSAFSTFKKFFSFSKEEESDKGLKR